MTKSDNANQNIDSNLTDINEIDDSFDIVTPIRKVTRKKKLTDTHSVSRKATGSSKINKKKKLPTKSVTSKKKPNKPHEITHTYTQTKRSIIGISVLFLLVIGSAILVVQQVNQYRKSFAQTQVLRSESNTLETEWQQLLLEQETVGGTTKIGGRAQTSMNMYLPKQADTYMVNLNPISPNDPKQKVITEQ